MSDEKKPFAEVTLFDDAYVLTVDGHNLVADEPDVIAEAVDRINAAVEEREGALRYVLAATADAVERALSLHEFADDERTEVAAMARFARQLLEGGGPDYVPAAELKALKDSLAVYQPMIDQLLEAGGQATEVGYRLARALGLLDVRDDLAQIAAKMLTDDELRAECTRRRMPIAPLPPFDRFASREVANFAQNGPWRLEYAGGPDHRYIFRHTDFGDRFEATAGSAEAAWGVLLRTMLDRTAENGGAVSALAALANLRR